jgi:hypothetical protein
VAPPPSPFTTSMNFSGSMTFTDPLPANSDFCDTNNFCTGLPGVDFSFSDGIHTYTPFSASFAFYDFQVDQNGKIFRWQFSLCCSGVFETDTDSLGVKVFDDQEGQVLLAQTGIQGSWSGPIAVPEPGTLALAAIGLSMLGAARSAAASRRFGPRTRMSTHK